MRKLNIKNYIFNQELYLYLGFLIYSFFLAWDFIDFYNNPFKLDLLSDTYYNNLNDVAYFEKLRLTIILLKYIIKIGYWGFFILLMIFVLSFIYVNKKLTNKDTVFIYFILLTLPTMRYGVWDYGVNATDGFVYLIMIWNYYAYKMNKKKLYYFLSVVGIFTREFCLYVNLYFIIENYMEDIKPNFKDIIKNISNWKKVVKNSIFEIIVIFVYLIYRMVFTFLFDNNPFKWGVVQNLGFMRLILEPKLLFVLLTALGVVLPYYIIKLKNIKSLIFIALVIVPSVLLGLIWEVNKIGCVFVIIVPELFLKNNKKKKIDDSIDEG